MPGRVDLWGHSHQLWHCAVVLAAYIHYHAVLVMLEWRDAAGGCAAPGLVNGPVPELLAQLQQQGVEVLGIDGVWQHLGVQMHKWAVAGAADVGPPA
jgi:predicted membrane channel-forming protein YqfA (hemolysin III family)